MGSRVSLDVVEPLTTDTNGNPVSCSSSLQCDCETLDEERKYICPDMVELVPKLKNYCGLPPNYECVNLQNIMFGNANKHSHGNDKIFKRVINPSNLDEEYMAILISGLMNGKEHPSVIIETCKEFQRNCDRLKEEDLQRINKE